jgi:hypothetical protein
MAIYTPIHSRNIDASTQAQSRQIVENTFADISKSIGNLPDVPFANANAPAAPSKKRSGNSLANAKVTHAPAPVPIGAPSANANQVPTSSTLVTDSKSVVKHQHQITDIHHIHHIPHEYLIMYLFEMVGLLLSKGDSGCVSKIQKHVKFLPHAAIPSAITETIQGLQSSTSVLDKSTCIALSYLVLQHMKLSV